MTISQLVIWASRLGKVASLRGWHAFGAALPQRPVT